MLEEEWLAVPPIRQLLEIKIRALVRLLLALVAGSNIAAAGVMALHFDSNLLLTAAYSLF